MVFSGVIAYFLTTENTPIKRKIVKKLIIVDIEGAIKPNKTIHTTVIIGIAI